MTIINAATIYSTLGNPSSLIPLAIKDMSATAGMTAGSFVTGKEEGQDRLIDELGTQAIWLLGIPTFKWIFDKTIFKCLKIDSTFDARNFKNADIFEKTKKYAQSEEVRKSIEKIEKNKNLFKNSVTAKFIFSTGLTVVSYIGLTKFKQNYTEKKIRKNLIDEYNNKNKQDNNSKKYNDKPNFKGLGKALEYFAFDPVRNMYIIDGAITGERLKDSRSPQEFIGYTIKEASTLCFMYYAGGRIQKAIENHAKKHYNKTIGIDARVIEAGDLKKSFEDKSIEKYIQEFEQIKPASKKGKLKKDAGELYEFIHTHPDNIITKIAKQADIINMCKTPVKKFGITYKYTNTEQIDTRKYIHLEDYEGICKRVTELYEQYKTALANGETSEKFFNSVKKLKRNSILLNIGSCIFALGILTPAIMLLKRYTNKDDEEFQTKKKIREQLIAEGIIK